MQTVFHCYNTFQSTVHTYKGGVNRMGSAATGCVTVEKNKGNKTLTKWRRRRVLPISLGNRISER